MELRKPIKTRRDFPSSDGINTVAGWLYEPAEGPVRGVVQISHGMCEYIGRYDELAAWLCSKGYAVCGNDHLGHGATSDGEAGVNGYMGEKDGWIHMVKDLRRMTILAKSWKPGVPVILLGHSMGSFLARAYASQWGDEIDGLVICGTGGPNPAVDAGLALTELIARTKGPTYRSEKVKKIAFGGYLKKIKDPRTPNDWLTRDEAIVDAYCQDPKCTYLFTVSGFHDLMTVIKRVSGQNWADKLPRQLPVWVVSGEEDPVGDWGSGVKKVHSWLVKAGMQDLRLSLYPGMRHEVFNEVGREAVFEDLLNWLDHVTGHNEIGGEI